MEANKFAGPLSSIHLHDRVLIKALDGTTSALNIPRDASRLNELLPRGTHFKCAVGIFPETGRLARIVSVEVKPKT